MAIKVAVLKETGPSERLAAIVRAVADKRIKVGAEVHMQSGAGVAAKLPDSSFKGVTFQMLSQR